MTKYFCDRCLKEFPLSALRTVFLTEVTMQGGYLTGTEPKQFCADDLNIVAKPFNADSSQ